MKVNRFCAFAERRQTDTFLFNKNLKSGWRRTFILIWNLQKYETTTRDCITSIRKTERNWSEDKNRKYFLDIVSIVCELVSLSAFSQSYRIIISDQHSHEKKTNSLKQTNVHTTINDFKGSGSSLHCILFPFKGKYNTKIVDYTTSQSLTIFCHFKIITYNNNILVCTHTTSQWLNRK